MFTAIYGDCRAARGYLLKLCAEYAVGGYRERIRAVRKGYIIAVKLRGLHAIALVGRNGKRYQSAYGVICGSGRDRAVFAAIYGDCRAARGYLVLSGNNRVLIDSKISAYILLLVAVVVSIDAVDALYCDERVAAAVGRNSYAYRNGLILCGICWEIVNCCAVLDLYRAVGIGERYGFYLSVGNVLSERVSYVNLIILLDRCFIDIHEKLHISAFCSNRVCAARRQSVIL